jgi:hypothetical protein
MLWHFVLGSYSNAQDSSLVTTQLRKHGLVWHIWMKSLQVVTVFRVLICETVWNTFLAYLPVSQLFMKNLMNHLHLWFHASTAMLMRSALFWDIMQHRVVILYRRFGTTYRSHLQGSRSLETSIKDYHLTLCNIPEEHRSRIIYS